MKNTNTTSGFSLVEIMIAAAALGGLAMVGMQLTKTQTKSSAKATFDSEANLITNEIVAILSDPAKCLTTLGGKSALSTLSGINSINTDRYLSTVGGSAPANGYGNAGIHIDSYRLTATAAEIAKNNSALFINYKNKEILKGNSGAALVTKKINMYVDVDASNIITKCRSLSSSSTDIWTRGKGSTINYMAGNVGIGSIKPESLLNVAGPISTTWGISFNTDFTASGWQQTDNGFAGLLQFDPALGNFYFWNSPVSAGAGALNPLPRQSLTINKTGNVGIGMPPEDKLTVMASGADGISIQAAPYSPTDSGDLVFRNNDGSERARIQAGSGANTLNFSTSSINQLSLDSSGNAWLAGTLTQASDRRLKKNVTVIDHALEKILALNGVNYFWRDQKKSHALQMGLIAQDVEKSFPEAISTDQAGFKSVAYSNLVAPVIEAVKELHLSLTAGLSRLESLELENKKIRLENLELKNYLCKKDETASFCHSDQ